jgi:hypothetical protein
MDFRKRELRFRLKDQGGFSERQVKEALQARGFPQVEVRAGPS